MLLSGRLGRQSYEHILSRKVGDNNQAISTSKKKGEKKRDKSQKHNHKQSMWENKVLGTNPKKNECTSPGWKPNFNRGSGNAGGDMIVRIREVYTLLKNRSHRFIGRNQEQGAGRERDKNPMPTGL